MSAEPLQTLGDVAERYDAFLIDQFGVLLNGVGAYPEAPGALQRLAQSGKRIVLLSNSGKRAEPNIARLLGLGFDRRSFDTVLSSGEVAYRHLLQQTRSSQHSATRVWVIAEQADVQLRGLPLQLAEDPADAELLLIAGSDPRYVSLDSYRELLTSFAQRAVPCLCTNPDVTRLSVSGTTFAPGAVAKLYESLGGTVQWIGKPYPLMYDVALDLLGRPDRSRVLCIGDSPAHDIAGGQAAGLCTALVTSGIHAGESLSAIREYCQALGVSPDHVITRFTFEA